VIYFCIPAHDEARTVGVLLWKIRTVMGAFDRDYQFLVVDDASTDGTPETLEPYARVLPLHVRRNEERLGYAAALEQAIREAVRRSSYPKRDVIVTLQADFTEEPDQIPDLVKRIEGGADIVSGRVEMARGGPSGARWSRQAWRFLLSPEDEEQHDPVSGLRAYRVFTLKRAIQDAGDRPLLNTDGWAANAELLARALPHARRAEEVPVHMRYDRRERASRFRPEDEARALLAVLENGDAVDRRTVPMELLNGGWEAPARHASADE